MTKKSTVTGAGDTESFEHSGDGDTASICMRGLHLGSHFRIDSGCQSFPRMPISFLGHQERPEYHVIPVLDEQSLSVRLKRSYRNPGRTFHRLCHGTV